MNNQGQLREAETSANGHAGGGGRILTVALGIVSIAYLLQIASPLRLVNDGMDYLLQASSAIDGHGFLVHGVRSMRPPGYPALIFLLAKIGVGRSWAFVALNCVGLGVGIWASHHLLRASLGVSGQTARIICLLTSLSFVMVRNVTYPLSDICFFGASATCLLGLVRAEGYVSRSRVWRLILLIPMMGFCFEVRTIGIALVPAWLWVLISGPEGVRKSYGIVRRHRLISVVILCVVIVVAGRVLLNSRYMQFNAPIFQHRGVVRTIAANVRDHTAEWGEMAVNVPVSRLPGAAKFPVQILGACTMFVVAAGIWTKAKRADSLLVYMVGYACIVIAYPWFDTRLWLPVIPFVMAYALVGLQRFARVAVLRPAMIAYCLAFCMLGAMALGYSTRLTFSGAQFPEVFGDGGFRNAYRVVLRGEGPADGRDPDPDAVYLLRRYEWRVRER